MPTCKAEHQSSASSSEWVWVSAHWWILSCPHNNYHRTEKEILTLRYVQNIFCMCHNMLFPTDELQHFQSYWKDIFQKMKGIVSVGSQLSPSYPGKVKWSSRLLQSCGFFSSLSLCFWRVTYLGCNFNQQETHIQSHLVNSLVQSPNWLVRTSSQGIEISYSGVAGVIFFYDHSMLTVIQKSSLEDQA